MNTIFTEYFQSRDHIMLEKLDADNNIKAINEWVGNDQNRKAFLYLHIKLTREVFGPWNCESSFSFKF